MNWRAMAALLGAGVLASPDIMANEWMPTSATGETVANAGGTCLVVDQKADITIEDMLIGPCGGHGIEIVDSRNVVVRNVRISGTKEIGILIRGSDNVDVVESVVIDTLGSVHAESSTHVRVTGNVFRNARGPIPRGQFVQFDKVRGEGNRVMCNVGRNDDGFGTPEDAINMYKSSGTPESPIVIERNTISGGGPSLSGGGIMLGDDGGSFQVARDNILEDPGQYGIAVASGHDMEISGNVVTARRQPFTNVGISVWNQYPSEGCRDITVRGNIVRWISQTGSPNPWWTGGNCGPVRGLTTNAFAATDDVIARRRTEIREKMSACRIARVED